MQRIFREETGKALAICRHPARERGETVHETRKHLKKLRAAIDLVAPEIGKRAAREDRCARDIGKLVSDLRDAHVRLQTLIELRGRYGEIRRAGKSSDDRAGKFFRCIRGLARAGDFGFGRIAATPGLLGSGGFDVEECLSIDCPSLP